MDTINLSPCWKMLSSQPLRFLYLISLAIFFVIICLWGTPEFLAQYPRHFEWPGQVRSPGAHSSLQAIYNETLGFQKVLCISSPSRGDKRDAIVLGSSLTGFQVNWVNQEDSEEDPSSNEYPPFEDSGLPRIPGGLGNWRAHVDALERVVSERLTTALIIKDDLDWDATLMSQLLEFATASQSLQALKSTSRPYGSRASVPDETLHSPYGEKWDVLWLGHCGMECGRKTPYYKRTDDLTAVPAGSIPQYWTGPAVDETTDKAPNTRLVCRARYVICTNAYAVTYKAAKSILAALMVLPPNETIPPGVDSIFDVSFGRFCEMGVLRCFSSFPSLMGTWKPAALHPPSSHSDIQTFQNVLGEVQEPLQEPTSHGVVYSTMMNIPAILHGGQKVKSAVDGVLQPELDLNYTRPDLGGRMYIFDHDTMVEKEL